MTARSVLRCQVRELSGGTCEWCQQKPGTSLAHIRSIGMGGRRSADTVGNVFWACPECAAMSDGLQPSGWPAFAQAHARLLGDDWEWRIPLNRWGWERAEALTKHVARRRATLGFKEEP